MSGNDATEKIIITKTEEEEELINDGKHIYQSTTADFNTKELTSVSNEDPENICEEASTSAVKATGSSSADNQVEESIDEAPEHSMPLDVDTEPIVGINVSEETVNDVSEDIDRSVSSDSSLQTEADIVVRNHEVKVIRFVAFLLLSLIIIAILVAAVTILHYTFKAF
ncbi:uncharacterized protein LOC143452157 isoform X1 [Clavelina lepadiformis]|uniref:uncharacterized protein LOC143452157 isoform X1 n=1 Tax=Clavelina lepadiformis TaxID=159417 RepID=UPI004041595E